MTWVEGEDNKQEAVPKAALIAVTQVGARLRYRRLNYTVGLETVPGLEWLEGGGLGLVGSLGLGRVAELGAPSCRKGSLGRWEQPRIWVRSENWGGSRGIRHSSGVRC